MWKTFERSLYALFVDGYWHIIKLTLNSALQFTFSVLCFLLMTWSLISILIILISPLYLLGVYQFQLYPLNTTLPGLELLGAGILSFLASLFTLHLTLKGCYYVAGKTGV